MPHVTAVGFSHLQALNAAQLERTKKKAATFELTTLLVHPPTYPSFDPWFEQSSGGIVYNAKIGEAVADACAQNSSSLLVLSLWSNQHFRFSTCNDPRRFDFVLPSDPARPVDPAAENVPYELIRSFMHEVFAVNFGLAVFLRKFCSLPTIVLAAPPPIDELEKIPPVTQAVATMEYKARELGIAPAGLRYKFWRVCEILTAEFCQAAGLPFVEPPAQSFKKDRFRQPQYWSQDWLHANAAYGDLVLVQIESFL